jgi:hypothetical protein
MLRSAFVLGLLASTAQADITVTFSEGAPKDRFTISTDTDCDLGPLTVRIDLGTSAAGLIFDTTSKGAGVEVFQPLELVSGAAQIFDISPVNDGDSAVELRLKSLSASQPVAFTVDVDDTIGQREITVSRSEIAGAQVTVTANAPEATAIFGQNAAARVPMAVCTS